MPRYLLYISYLGTQFRSVQKHSLPAEIDTRSVQGILEICSERFKTVNKPSVYLASRTDQGVHALRSCAHVDLVHRNGEKYDPESLLRAFNKSLRRLNTDLRLQNVREVPDTFHVRHSAKSRTYLYRLAVRKPTTSNEYPEIPYAEWNRCHFVQKSPQFDVSLMKRAAALFPGIRDFRTFMSNKAKLPEDTSTIRDMHRLEIVPGKPLLSPEYCPSSLHYDYWDVICQSRSFLYRQVRRIIGTLIHAAQGHITIDEIKYMLDNPSKHSWKNGIVVVPAYGLYLINVEYDPLDMILPFHATNDSSDISDSSKLSVAG